MIEKLEWIIFYFEGTCEICLGNRGIEKYKNEIDEYISILESFSEDIKLRIFYASAVISYKLDQQEQAYKSFLKALDYAKKINDQLYIGKISSYLAIYHYIKRNTKQEQYYFNEAVSIFKENQYYGELANHYINILWFKRYEKDPREAIEYMDKALYYVQMSDSKKNARVYLHLGYIHKTIFNDFVQGIQHLIKSMELSREYGFVEMESMTLHVLADGYSQIDKFNETVNIYNSIMQNDRYKDITANLKAAVLCNLIRCYLKLEDVDNAGLFLKELETVMPNVQENIRERYYAIMLGLKGELHCLKRENLNAALALIHESKQIYDRYKDNFLVEDFEVLTLNRMGDLHYALGDYRTAIQYYQSMKELVPDDNMYCQKTIHERLAASHEAIEEYGTALNHLKACNTILLEIRKKKTQEQYETMYKHFLKDIHEKEMDKLSELNVTLEKDSNMDGLTGLFNRNFLDKYLAERSSNPDVDSDLTMIMIDIDSFKNYNDNYGHEKGDRVLQKVAELLIKRCEGITEKVIRFGGEEFLIILENCQKSDSIELSKHILQLLANEDIEHLYSEVEKYVTVSIGIATCITGARCDGMKLIEAADQALYSSKKNGKNRYTHIDSMCEYNLY